MKAQKRVCVCVRATMLDIHSWTDAHIDGCSPVNTKANWSMYYNAAPFLSFWGCDGDDNDASAAHGILIHSVHTISVSSIIKYTHVNAMKICFTALLQSSFFPCSPNISAAPFSFDQHVQMMRIVNLVSVQLHASVAFKFFLFTLLLSISFLFLCWHFRFVSFNFFVPPLPLPWSIVDVPIEVREFESWAKTKRRNTSKWNNGTMQTNEMKCILCKTRSV